MSVLIETELTNDKAVPYKTKVIESVRFMTSSLSSPGDNLAEGLRDSKCKKCKSCLEYVKVKDKLLIFKYLKCNKTIKQNFNEDLVKRFANAY